MIPLTFITGIVGILLLIAVFQVNDRKMILRLQIICCVVWTAYYLSMGAYTGAGLIFLGAIRSFLYERYRDKEWPYPLTIAALGIATLITWENWTSALALVAMIMASTALWQRDPRMIRMFSLGVSPFWLTYNIISGSYFGVVGDLVTFTSVVVGVWRFDLMPFIQQRRRRAVSTEVSDVSLV